MENDNNARGRDNSKDASTLQDHEPRRIERKGRKDNRKPNKARPNINSRAGSGSDTGASVGGNRVPASRAGQSRQWKQKSSSGSINRGASKSTEIAASAEKAVAESLGNLDAIQEIIKENTEKVDEAAKTKKLIEDGENRRIALEKEDVLQARLEKMKIKWGELRYGAWARNLIFFLIALIVPCTLVVLDGIVYGTYGRHAVLCGVFCQLIIMALVVFLMSPGKKYKYTFKRWVHFEENFDDLRADSIAVGKLKHNNPRIALVEFQSYYDGPCGWLWSPRRMTLKPSVELLSQITTAANLPLASNDEIAFERLNYVARNLHSVNVNRYDPLVGDYPVQDAVLVAFAIYKSMLETRDIVPFPRRPASM